MDWDALTQGWVDEGLITADQRGPLADRLRALPTSPSLPMGPLLTVLVAPAAFLMVGSMVAVLAALGLKELVLYDAVVGGSAALLTALGLALRFVPKVQPLARGLLAAAIPMATWVAGRLGDEVGGGVQLVVLIPPLVAWAGGVLENSRAVTATAATAFTLATWYVCAELHLRESMLAISTLTVFGLFAANLLGRALPARATSLHVGAPALALLGVTLAVVGPSLVPDAWIAPGSRGWELEKGLTVLIYGVATLAAGMVSRSAWSLVPGVMAIAASTIWIAFTYGDFLGGAIALAVVSVALFALAMVLWVRPGRIEEG